MEKCNPSLVENRSAVILTASKMLALPTHNRGTTEKSGQRPSTLKLQKRKILLDKMIKNM